MSRTSAPVLTSLLLLLLLLPRDSEAAAVSKHLELKSCKTLDEVLLEKYVTRPKRSLSDDDVNATTTPLPSGSSDSNWRGLYLLLQDRAEQLCDKTLYLQLKKRFSEELANSDRQDNGATTSAVPQTESKDQQANNATPSPTAQKESTRVNASTTIAFNDDDESSGKFHGEDSTLTGNLNQTFDNEVSGNNETSSPSRDNEDESEANEAIHARSKEEFLASVRRDKRPRLDQDDDEIVAKFFEAEEEIIDGANGPYGADGNGTVDEDDRLVNEFFANEESMGFDDGNTTSSEYDKFVDDFFANESNTSGDNETVSEEDNLVNDFFANESADLSDIASNENKTVSAEDKFVDDFFANGDFSNSDNETVSEDDELVKDFFANESADLSDSDNKTGSEEDKLVNDFSANERENFSGNGSNSDVVKGHDEFVDEFFANENENGNRRNEASGHQKITPDDNKSNETASEDHLVDDFFASENENFTGNGIEVEESNRDSNGTTLDEKANNNKTASSEFNSTESHGDVPSSSKLTPSLELFVAALSGEQDNSTNPGESMTNNSTMPLGEVTKSLEEFFAEAANSTSDFSNNSTGIPRDFLELISLRDVAIDNEKNATTAQPYSNETATTANGTEDRSAKYPDTGDRDKAGHTPSGDDLFKETTATTPSSDDWSSTIASIESPNEATEPSSVRRRRRDILMTFQDDDTTASAGKLRAPEATSSSSRLVDDEDDDAWESSDSSSRNRPARIISVEMNKGGELRRQYRTLLLGLAPSGQTQFAEKRDSRRRLRRRSRASTEVEQ